MTNWQKWQVDKMTSRQVNKLTNWQVDKNDKLAKQKMQFYKRSSYQNSKLIKCQVGQTFLHHFIQFCSIFRVSAFFSWVSWGFSFNKQTKKTFYNWWFTLQFWTLVRLSLHDANWYPLFLHKMKFILKKTISILSFINSIQFFVFTSTANFLWILIWFWKFFLILLQALSLEWSSLQIFTLRVGS
jgi:hypothetical protein